MKIKSVLTAFLIIALTLPILTSCSGSKSPCLDAALKAARWLDKSAIKTESGLAWPANPDEPDKITNDLYVDTPGVLLFYLELYYMTQNDKYLETACRGADHLLTVYQDAKFMGLYEGMAGIGFALEETYKASQHEKYRLGFLNILELLKERAIQKEKGIEWGGSNDIISGTAGIGLFLIYAYEELNAPEWLEIACEAGRGLIAQGIPDHEGLKWPMALDYPRLMPNFSHGTAGICYLLARLYETTQNDEFLQSASAGIKYLKAVAQEDTCLVFHHEPEGEDLFYLGWCHGPVGTARLFFKMYQLTGDESMMDWVKKSAQAIIDSGIPDKQTPGFWNNVGICCGQAGVADFFLELYKATGEKKYDDFKQRVIANILDWGTEEDGMIKWIHADSRTKPDIVIAQTGLMQGAAGIGLVLLHCDAATQGKSWNIQLPDSPYSQK